MDQSPLSAIFAGTCSSWLGVAPSERRVHLAPADSLAGMSDPLARRTCYAPTRCLANLGCFSPTRFGTPARAPSHNLRDFGGSAHERGVGRSMPLTITRISASQSG